MWQNLKNPKFNIFFLSSQNKNCNNDVSEDSCWSFLIVALVVGLEYNVYLDFACAFRSDEPSNNTQRTQ
jgi:hypothetical protein